MYLPLSFITIAHDKKLMEIAERTIVIADGKVVEPE
jgi:ABC-type lipoprotein export system ATPase subunit